MKLRDGLLAAALTVTCLAAPTYAQTNNSNTTGVSSSAPVISVGGRTDAGSGSGSSSTSSYSASTVAQAQSLAQALAAAQSAVDKINGGGKSADKPASVDKIALDQTASNGIRSFTRTASPGGGSGVSAERAQLEANLLKAQNDAAAFLDSVRNPRPDQLGAAQNTGTKVGPTW